MAVGSPRPLRWGKSLTLIPLAFLVASACSQAQTYTGVQPRTAIDKIPAGGQLKNFTLVGQNPLVESKYNLPRGQNGGITAIRDCVYVGPELHYQPTPIPHMKDMTKPTPAGRPPGRPP